MIMHHARQRHSAGHQRANDGEIGHLVNVHRIRLERRERGPDHRRIVAGPQREARIERGLPARLIFARARPVQDARGVTPRGEFGGGDMGVGLGPGQGAKAFVNV